MLEYFALNVSHSVEHVGEKLTVNYRAPTGIHLWHPQSLSYPDANGYTSYPSISMGIGVPRKFNAVKAKTFMDQENVEENHMYLADLKRWRYVFRKKIGAWNTHAPDAYEQQLEGIRFYNKFPPYFGMYSDRLYLIDRDRVIPTVIALKIMYS